MMADQAGAGSAQDNRGGRGDRGGRGRDDRGGRGRGDDRGEKSNYIERVVNHFKEQRHEGEQFREWIVRADEEDLK